MISIKTPQQIATMGKGGKILGGILLDLLDNAKVGTSLLALEEIAQEKIKKVGATPSFSTVKGYRWATCLCVNEEVVHGPPRPYILKDGDLLTIDVGMVYEGFHTDTAWSKIITNKELGITNKEYNDTEKFLKIGKKALDLAIQMARPGNRVGHISQVIEETITGAGYSVVTALTGHGVGKTLHEEPMIPEYLEGPIERTPLLTVGMTLAIEVIYALEKGSLVYPNEDGWTLSTKDRSLTAVFEHTVGILSDETIVLTKV